MAKNLKLISGGTYINNPILYSVENDPLSDEKPTFHRVKVEVICALDGDKEWTTRTSNKSISDSTKSNTVQVDISSALRAVSEDIEYTASKLKIPTVKYWLRAYDEYMVDGTLHTESGVTTVGSATASRTCYVGGFTDRERLKNDITNTKYSLKPTTSQELVCKDEVMVCPKSRTESEEVTISATGAVKGRNAYAVTKTTDHYLFRFVNSRGLLESCSCRSMAKVSQDMEVEEYAHAMQETMTKFSRRSIKKSTNNPVIAMNTGVLDKAWLQWWEEEFLQSQHHWMYYDGIWVNCTIKADDSFSTIDRQKGDPLNFAFEVTLDFNGAY